MIHLQCITRLCACFHSRLSLSDFLQLITYRSDTVSYCMFTCQSSFLFQCVPELNSGVVCITLHDGRAAEYLKYSFNNTNVSHPSQFNVFWTQSTKMLHHSNIVEKNRTKGFFLLTWVQWVVQQTWESGEETETRADDCFHAAAAAEHVHAGVVSP